MLVPWRTCTSIHSPQLRLWWKLPERLPEKAQETEDTRGLPPTMHCPEAREGWFCAARAGIFSPWHMERSKRHNLLWVGKSQHKKGTSVHIRKHAGPGGTLDGPSSRYITIKRTLPRHPKSNSLASVHSFPFVSLVHVALTEKNVASNTNFTVPTSSYESMPTWTVLDILDNHTWKSNEPGRRDGLVVKSPWLRACTTLPEDPSLVSNIHINAQNCQ